MINHEHEMYQLYIEDTCYWREGKKMIGIVIEFVVGVLCR